MEMMNYVWSNSRLQSYIDMLEDACKDDPMLNGIPERVKEYKINKRKAATLRAIKVRPNILCFYENLAVCYFTITSAFTLRANS